MMRWFDRPKNGGLLVAATLCLVGGAAWGQTAVPGPGLTLGYAAGSAALGATTYGPIQNVLGQGAKLNGTTDDSSPFNLARTAAGANGTIFVPPGGVYVNSIPTGGSSSPVLWKFSGNTYTTGTTQVGYFGNDEVETFFNGGLALFKTQASGSIPSPAFRVDDTYAETASTVTTNTVNALWVNAIVPAPATSTSYVNNYFWPMNCSLTDSGIGVAQNVCIQSNVNRPAITDAFGPRVKDWVFAGQFQDNTGLKSSLGGAAEGMELDIYANDDDDALSRVNLQLVVGKQLIGGISEKVNRGILLNRNDTTSFHGYGIDDQVPWDTAGIRLSGGSLAVTLSTSIDQGGASATLTFGSTSAATDNRVRLGMFVNCSGISGTYTVNAIANGVVTLASSTSANVPINTACSFGSNAPAIAISQNNAIEFNGVVGPSNSAGRRLFYNTGNLIYQVNGTNIYDWTDAGNFALTGFLSSNGTLLGGSNITSCGSGPTVTTPSYDMYGSVTPGSSATSCTVGLSKTHSTGLVCTVTAQTTVGAGFYVNGYTTTSFTVNFTTAGKFGYTCMG